MLWSLKNKMFDLNKAVGFSLWEKCVSERTKNLVCVPCHDWPGRFMRN